MPETIPDDVLSGVFQPQADVELTYQDLGFAQWL
jgi:hypothetical protein